MRTNKMKEKLRAGQPAFGVSMMIPSPQTIEMVGRLGFDWVLIDCEHGTISLETVEILAMAAEASGITAIARPRTKDPDDILKVMDRGVMGVQVPHINTAEDAQQAVELCVVTDRRGNSSDVSHFQDVIRTSSRSVKKRRWESNPLRPGCNRLPGRLAPASCCSRSGIVQDRERCFSLSL